MRVVVTGAAGFIGSHLVEGLLARGHHVIGIDRRSLTRDAAAASNLQGALGHPAFALWTADLAIDNIGEALADCDTVYHLAAMAGVRSSWGAEFGDYVTHNIVATHRLVTACETARVRRLVLASSASVYGNSSVPSAEHDPTAPISPYGVTKLAAEQLCRAHARRHDTALTTVALRYFSVYGPRQRPDMVVRRILMAALQEAPMDLYGDGTQRRDFTYVSDVVEATIAAAALDVPHAVINVGGGTSVRLLDMVELASDLTGSPVRVERVAAQAGDVHATAADLAVARALLDYRPRVGLREGVAAELEWLTSHYASGFRPRLPLPSPSTPRLDLSGSTLP